MATTLFMVLGLVISTVFMVSIVAALLQSLYTWMRKGRK